MTRPTVRKNRRDRAVQLPAICWRQWRTERHLRRSGVDFRTTEAPRVREAYSRMTSAEFAAINGRHAWACARTLGKSLNKLVGAGPVSAVDLGSGNGTSTRVLARLLPAGSRILGLELTEPLVEMARRRPYRARDGSSPDVSFSVQSVAETFTQPDGRPLASGSVDLVNASGILGHHLSTTEIRAALDEISRVLADGGIAALDVGPRLTTGALTRRMRRRGFTRLRRSRSQPLDPTGQVVFRKTAKSPS